jgi:anti-anti-sigma factor
MYKEDDFKIEATEEKGIPIIYIYGDVTSETDSEITEFYQKIASQGKNKIIINFTHISYINSAGIAILINIITDVADKKGQVIFVNLSSHFQKVMDIVGLTDFVDIYGTNEEALKVLGAV